MRMPNGFKLKDGRDRKSHVLKLIKNIYGLRQEGGSVESASAQRTNRLGIHTIKD